MQEFYITLKNDKYRLYDRFAVFIFLLNAAGIITTLFIAGRTQLQKATGGVTLLSLLVVLLVYISSSKKVKKEYYFLFAILFTSLYWVLLGFWWPGGLIIILAVLYTYSKKKLVVRVAAAQIRYPSFPVRHIQWQELSNVVLKDGLLSIDFNNNRFIQQPVEENRNMVNEQEFNDFCRQQLKKTGT